MDLYDWLLFLHVLSAFLAVGALTALWALVLSSSGATPMVSPASAMRFGQTAGIAVGVAIPWSVQFFVENMKIPISTLSIAIAFGVSCVVGLAFGLLPANRASRLNPTEALRYE